MIRNKLAVLMAERQLKITKIANDTNISRTTLTALAQNESKMIQNDTINTICKYLKITPCDFFEYSPIDVSFYFELGEVLTSQKDLNKGAPFMVEASGFINFSKYDEKMGSMEFQGIMEDIGPIGYISNDEHLYGYHVTIKPLGDSSSFLDQLSIAFQTDIKEKYEKFIIENLKKNSKENNVEYSVSLSFEPKIELEEN